MFWMVLHSVVLRYSPVVKRAVPPCVARPLLFAAVLVCFYVALVMAHALSSLHSAGAQTQFINIRSALEVARHRTTIQASRRDVNNCAPLPLMSAKAFRVPKNSLLSSAYSGRTKAPLKHQKKIYIPHSTAASNDAKTLNARARLLNVRALNMRFGSVSRGRKYICLCHLTSYGHGAVLSAFICACGAFIYSYVIANILHFISSNIIMI